jgi:hypothetical protein
MKKRLRKKKRYTNKRVSIQWGWMLAGGALIVSCLLLVAIATSQGRASTSDATTYSPATNSNAPTSIRSEATTTTINADQITGVFPLSAGGPIPVPANVLHPTNIARINVDNVLVSIYAGSMVRTPTIGVLAILRENLTTGEQSLHLYQTAQPVGALTILTAHGSVLTFSTPKAKGTFNLGTNQFRFKGK